MGCRSDDSRRTDTAAAMVSYPSVENVLLGANSDGPPARPERSAAGGAQSARRSCERIIRLGLCACGAARASSEPLLGIPFWNARPCTETCRAALAEAL